MRREDWGRGRGGDHIQTSWTGFRLACLVCFRGRTTAAAHHKAFRRLHRAWARSRRPGLPGAGGDNPPEVPPGPAAGLPAPSLPAPPPPACCGWRAGAVPGQWLRASAYTRGNPTRCWHTRPLLHCSRGAAPPRAGGRHACLASPAPPGCAPPPRAIHRAAAAHKLTTEKLAVARQLAPGSSLTGLPVCRAEQGRGLGHPRSHHAGPQPRAPVASLQHHRACLPSRESGVSLPSRLRAPAADPPPLHGIPPCPCRHPGHQRAPGRGGGQQSNANTTAPSPLSPPPPKKPPQGPTCAFSTHTNSL